jgi:UDP-glucose 4-epimerase
VIFDFVEKLKRDPTTLAVLGNGTQQKPYLHVSELLDAMLFIWQNTRDRVNLYNIAPMGEGTSVRRIAELVVQAVAPSAHIQYGESNRGWVGDVPTFTYDTSKLTALGWAPTLSSGAAVERAVSEVARERWV